MLVERDTPIAMDDGVVLRADVFRPAAEGRYPVILSHGPYAKGLAFQEGYASQWARLVETAPEVLEGSSNKYQCWELVDPEKWVPDGYICVRVDSRGAGRSPGRIDIWSPRETRDLYHCIEWAGAQPWSNGKVGLNGISYYATNQWQVGALRPPHLAALCIWEGFGDYYRELARHGGILSGFLASWYPRQVLRVQHGAGGTIAGPETLAPEVLARNAADPAGEALRRPLLDDYYRERLVEYEKIDAPLLSAANWGGQGLHPRGNFEGYRRAGSREKWLEVHGSTHFTHFYSRYGMALQKRFFDFFLKNKPGWESQPRVSLNIRQPGERFTLRAESEWPLARTQWTRFYLDPDGLSLSTKDRSFSKNSLAYETTGDGITFSTAPMQQELEITGPLAAKLWLSSDTADADVFLALRVFDPSGKEISFVGSNDPRTPIALGWLRASHRKLDGARSLPYRPWHAHDELQPLVPGQPVELDVEIWPTCIAVPPGYRIALTVRGKDYEHEGGDARLPNAPYPMKGVGPFTHADPRDRPPQVFGGRNTLHFGAGKMPYLLLPIIPGR